MNLLLSPPHTLSMRRIISHMDVLALLTFAMHIDRRRKLELGGGSPVSKWVVDRAGGAVTDQCEDEWMGCR